MEILLGAASEFLQTDGKVVSMRTDLIASTQTETDDSESTGDNGERRALDSSGYVIPAGSYEIEIDLSVEVYGEVLTKKYGIPLQIDEIKTQKDEQTTTSEDADDDESGSHGEKVENQSTEIESFEPKSEAESSQENVTPEEIPVEKQLAPVEEIEKLAKGLDKVAGLPLDVVIPPMNNE